MKIERDSIDWSVVHRTHEGNPEVLEDKQQQFYTFMQKDYHQKLQNLAELGLKDSPLAQEYSRQEQHFRSLLPVAV